jgi:hypothetical protein
MTAVTQARALVTRSSLDKQLSELSDAVGDAISKLNQRLVEDLQPILDRIRADIEELRNCNRSMAVRGTWAAGERYQALNVVALNGASFVARRDDPGPCPGEGWQLIASQGKRGGRAPAVAGMALSGTVLTLRNGDGSTASVDLAPLVSKIAQGRPT